MGGEGWTGVNDKTPSRLQFILVGRCPGQQYLQLTESASDLNYGLGQGSPGPDVMSAGLCQVEPEFGQFLLFLNDAEFD